MAKVAKMLKTKSMLPPDPDPMDEEGASDLKDETTRDERMEKTANKQAQIKTKQPSIAAMIKMAKTPKRSK